jgi:hypothetical protein
MSLPELIALQPAWLGIWMKLLVLGAFGLPVVLLFWRQSRRAGVSALVAGVLSAVMMTVMFNALGYVRLLGLPHLLFWGPLAVFLALQIRRADMPRIPRAVIGVVLATITISLVFDVVDVLRYALGDRVAFTGL